MNQQEQIRQNIYKTNNQFFIKCQHNFKSPSFMTATSHLLNKHSTKAVGGESTCADCKVTNSAVFQNRHKCKQDEYKKKFTCGICEDTFWSYFAYKSHRLKIHGIANEKEEEECQYCHKTNQRVFQGRHTCQE